MVDTILQQLLLSSGPCSLARPVSLCEPQISDDDIITRHVVVVGCHFAQFEAPPSEEGPGDMAYKGWMNDDTSVVCKDGGWAGRGAAGEQQDNKAIRNACS